ncbi:hypothetical protein R3P38DRAFT_2810096 [Favolaschia claudopus]|uniref:Uncharacterized protein n=1 Tax=Favolaschia claudopus TaxID=2862362 RepID=A0AAV9ZB73_9AGAR
MTAAQPPASGSSAAPLSELQELIALVARLSTATTEAMRLSVEVQARLPLVVGIEVAGARAAALSQAAAAAAEVDTDPVFKRQIAQTPADLVWRSLCTFNKMKSVYKK